MTSMAASRRINELPRSGIRVLMELAAQTPGAVRLEIGDPDFGTPEHIVEASFRAAREGYTHYSPSAGLPSLRALLAEKLAARNGIETTPERTVVTTGACGAIAFALLALLDPGDEVLVPDPGWPNYLPLAHAAGGVPIPYPLDPAHGFEPDLEALEAAVSPRTRVVVVNSPGNPTGSVLAPESVGALVDFAERHDLWLLSDECYEELLFEGRHVSPGALAPERTVGVFSFSKTYAMTGWRVGYASCPREIAALLAKAQEALVSSVSTVSQKAAEAALTGPQEPVAAMRDAYRARRDVALAALDAAGVGYVRPSGAFYLMVDIGEAEPSEAFAHSLLKERRVAVTPGRAFGACGEGMVRVSLAASEEAIAAGLERLAAAVAER
jgi:aspartate aminotransferase